MEHKLHHTYPAPGGYDDQDALLMQDWAVINRRVNHFFGLYKTPALDLDNIPGALKEDLF